MHWLISLFLLPFALALAVIVFRLSMVLIVFLFGMIMVLVNIPIMIIAGLFAKKRMNEIRKSARRY